MSRLALPPRGSLRRSVLAGAALSVLLLLTATTYLVHIQSEMRRTLTEATDALLEEQRIADRLLRAASLQLVAASFADRDRDPAVADQFRAAGDDVYEQIRAYLFRPLTTEQRRQLEAVREDHQRLEVAAAEAFAFYESGSLAQADAAAREAREHALRLQQTLDAFLRLREADLDKLRASQEAAFAYMAAAAVAFGLLALTGPALLLPFLERRLARPLVQLSDAARRVGSGEPGVRVPVPRRDELGSAARSFNEMAERLDRARADLRERNDELAEALRGLEEAQAELVQTEKLTVVGRLMAGLAHELNNPLASVLGYSELLSERLDAPGDAPDRDELRTRYVHPLVEEARRARSLVRHLLGFTRKSEGDLSPVPLAATVEQVAGLRRFAFQQASLRLLVDVEETLVLAEPQRLQQAILNLVNNAYDAMAEHRGGMLRIVSATEGDRVSVRFEDEGPGFPEPARAFEPFYTTKPPGEGTGLGLSLVHRFMEEFGGGVSATNRPGGGARVVLNFRRAEADVTEPPTPAPPPLDERIILQGLRVLVVEDEAPLRELQRRFLTRRGAWVLLASSGGEARAVLATDAVDVVVSDVKMPGGSGVELFRWVERERPELVDHFLFVTGDVGEEEMAELARERPERLLRKPFLMEEYLARVSSFAPAGAAGGGTAAG